jgi:RNA polymerase sigma-70 factor (ECF subfamily)
VVWRLGKTTDPRPVWRRAHRPGADYGPVIGEAFPSVLASAQEGDEAAFARLWRDVNPALLRYLTLGGDSADDVASETWATVIKRLPRFTGDETAWRAWVFTTARRRAIDAGRRRARTAELERPWRHWPVETIAADAAEAVIERLDTDTALRLVAQLPPLQAEVILLRVVGGLSVPEVARIVGRSPGAVRVAAHRGLRRLEHALSPGGTTEQAVTTSDPAAL